MENKTKTPASKDKSNVVWRLEDEALLVHTLKKAKQDGKWGDNNPKAVAWSACVVALSGSEIGSGGVAKDAGAVRRRWQRLKQEYVIFRNMHGQSGWGWNDLKNIPDISDDLWQGFVDTQSNKKLANALRKKGFPLFNKVGELVDDTCATGQSAFRPGQPAPAPPANAAIDPVLLAMSREARGVSDTEIDRAAPKDSTNTTNVPKTRNSFYEREREALTSTDDEGTDTRPDKGKATIIRKRSATPPNTGNDRRKTRRISAGQGMTSMATSMEAGIDRLTDAIIAGSANRTSAAKDLDLETKAIAVIEEEERFDKTDLAYAMIVMEGHRSRANVYLSMKDKEVRTAYLRRMMEKVKREDMD